LQNKPRAASVRGMGPEALRCNGLREAARNSARWNLQEVFRLRRCQTVLVCGAVQV